MRKPYTILLPFLLCTGCDHIASWIEDKQEPSVQEDCTDIDDADRKELDFIIGKGHNEYLQQDRERPEGETEEAEGGDKKRASLYHGGD